MASFDDLYLEIETQAKASRPNLFTVIANEKNKPLILYGAGGNCEFAMFTCAFSEVTVDGVCDKKATGTYKYKNQEYEIISPRQLIENEAYKDALILITSWRYEVEMKDYLIQLGISEERIYFLRYPNVISPEVFREKYLDGYRWAFEFLDDEISRRCIMNRIRLHLLGTPCVADSSYQDGYLAYPDFHVNDGEVYVDGGAYIGDTAEEFIDYCSREDKIYRHIYSFEPDNGNYKKAVENLKKYNNVDVVPSGLWSYETTLQFRSEQKAEYIGSHLVETAGQKTSLVPVTSLDTFFSGKTTEEWPTLIKMDIEGSEKEALIGGTKVIQEKKPRLIICAYHKPEDIYELPQTIIRLRKDYRIQLWQIGESFWDVILYAI